MRYKDETHDWIYITDEDAQKVIAHAREKWKLPLRVLYMYGMRVSELLALTPANIKNDLLVMQRRKRGKLTRQVLHPDIKEELLALARSRTPGSRLFPYARLSCWKAIREAGNRAGVDPLVCHPHAFRHACGRRWAQHFSINVVGSMMGHKTIRATMMYSDLQCTPELSKRVFGL